MVSGFFFFCQSTTFAVCRAAPTPENNRRAWGRCTIPLSAMAYIAPFRALRYDPTRVDLSQVVTQPYDKITPEMQNRYYDASPHNLVRIILGKKQPTDHLKENVYTRAAASLQNWRRQ